MTEEGKLYLFVAIDRTSKLAFAELYQKAGKMNAAKFLRHLIKAVPYVIHTILTEANVYHERQALTVGIQFTDRKTDRLSFEHVFDRTCRENGIEHRLTKINHPWTNGQVERMKRTPKDATVKRYDCESHNQLEQRLQTFLAAYNYARRLKTLRGLTPYEYICKCWTETPDRFRLNPLHHTAGPNT